MPGYHHGNLRASLIDTGVDLARSHGPEGVVLREVARRAGVSHNAAYRHFADREALLAEIAGVAMHRLAVAMREELEVADASGPYADEAAHADARLRATGRAYVDFAVANPGLFEVAFSVLPAEDGADGEADQATHPFGLLNLVLDECVEAGAVSPLRRPGAEVVCWAAVHGFAVLHVRGPLGAASETERSTTLEVMLDHIARGLA